VAAIQHSIGNSASRAGPGAIMGDKNLKAIAVYGIKHTYIAKPTEFSELCKYVLKRSRACGNWVRNWEIPYVKWLAETGPFGNFNEIPLEVGFENAEEILNDFVKKFVVKKPACYNCPVRCTATISLPGAGYVAMKCQAWFTFMLACKIPDMTFNTKCLDLCSRYGLDYISTSAIIAFAIDLYKKGILTTEDTEGMHLEWGNAEMVFSLLGKIARREGIGAVLANGVYEAASMIGRGAEKYVYHVKKLELAKEPLIPSSALARAAGDKAADAQTIVNCGTIPSMWQKDREEYLREGWFIFPGEFEKYLDINREVSYEGLGELSYYSENIHTLADLTGVCWWCMGFFPYPPIKLDTLTNLISYATGMDIDETEAIKMAERVRTLIRAFNVRLGVRRKDDAVPEKFFSEPPTLPQQQLGLMQLDHDKFDKELDKIYELRGWSSDGIPTKERLEELGLDYVRQDLERRAILSG